MTLLFDFQWAAIFIVSVYLVYSGVAAHRRMAQSWDSLAARLRKGNFVNIFVAGQSDAAGAGAYDEEFEARGTSRSGLWALFKGAGVVLEMADFAERASVPMDRAMLDSVRNDAMRSRVFALKALVFHP